MASSPPSLDPPSHRDVFEPVLHGLRRRQRSVLAVAALFAIAGILMIVTSIVSASNAEQAADTHIVQRFALGFVLLGILIAAIALNRLNPRNAQIYLLLKHKPEAIANVFFDIKHVRGYSYEYMVIQTHSPQHNYVVPGIQRFGILTTLKALRQLCPKARFSCSPTVKHIYFPEENSSSIS